MPTRDEIMQTILDRYLRDARSFEDAVNRIAADIRETMRSLALGTSALAAAALVLLSSDIPTDQALVLIGIITLMVESGLAFIWLLHVQTVAGEKTVKQRHTTLGPASKILTSHHDFQTGGKTEADFNTELREYLEESNKKARLNHDDEQEEPAKRDHWDKVFIGMLIFGILFLGLGIIEPHIPITRTAYTYIENFINQPHKTIEVPHEMPAVSTSTQIDTIQATSSN